MKSVLIIFFFAVLILSACKKYKPQPSAFDKATYEDVKKFEPQLDIYNITVKSSPPDESIDLKVGSVLFYKTSKSILGKLKIVSIDNPNPSNYSITIDIVNYDSGGNVILSKNNILINKLLGYDLDLGVVSDVNKDFVLIDLNAPGFSIVSVAGALFAVYSK